MHFTTDLHIKNARLPAGVAEKYVAILGHENLCLRLRPGRKDWYFRYRPDNGTVKKIALGGYPLLGLAEAKGKADALRKQLAEGIDPQTERQREKAAQAAAKAINEALPQNVRELFSLWQQRELTLRKDGGRKDGGTETLRKFEKDVFPRIGTLPLDTIRRAHIMQIIDEVKARGAPRIAGILLSDLRQMFTFAVDREIMTGDPTAGMKKSKFGGGAKERDRALTEDEIKQLAKSVPRALNVSGQHAVWIMLGTCCRIGEITKACWTDVDLEANTWSIPAENSKNAKPHTINLSPFVAGQFRTLKTSAEDSAKKAEKELSQWVLPARHNTGCVCAKSLAKQIGDRQRGAKEPMRRRSPLTDSLVLPGGRWTPHDLRRTGATLMGALGVRPDVIERCLNHTEQNKIQRIYQRAELRPEMTEAWRLLGERIELLIRTDIDNVTALPSRRRSPSAHRAQ
jgi:integrase